MSFNIGDKVRVTYKLSGASKNLDGQVCTISSRISNPGTSFASVSLEEDAAGGGVYVNELELVGQKYAPGTKLQTTEYGIITVSEDQKDNHGYLRARMENGSVGLLLDDEITGVVVESTPRYRVGDKVRFTETRGGYGEQIGTTGTIIEVLHGGRGYTVECPHTTGSGWSNLTFFDNEIEGLVEEEPLADWERELLEGPFAKEGVIYKPKNGGFTELEYRVVGEVVEVRKPTTDYPAHRNWSESVIVQKPSEITPEDYDAVGGEVPTVDQRSEMNQKMDTVREAGVKRRQKLIAHTHKLEAVIRDRNAEIEFLRGKLAVAHQGVATANDALYAANFDFVKPRKTTDIPF